MIKKIKRIVIPMITTVLIAGSCMVVSAGTAYKHLIGREPEPMNLGNSASQSYSVYAYVSSEYTYFEKIKATFGANSNDDDVVKAGLMATY